jgi:hypothetical protein
MLVTYDERQNSECDDSSFVLTITSDAPSTFDITTWILSNKEINIELNVPIR